MTTKACRLCWSWNLNKFLAREQVYYFCRNCELIFIDTEFFPSKKEEKRVYDRHENTLANQGYVNRFENFIDKIELKSKDIDTILDWWSWPNPVLAYILREYWYDVDIYDPYYAKHKVYKDKKYDIITSTEVFEHFENPLETIKLIYGLIKDDGWLAIMTNMHDADLDKFQDWRYTRDDTHIAFYSLSTFQYVASKFDMDIEYRDDEIILLQK